MAQPFKHPQSGVFYLRRKVPDELRAALGREFKRSLKTREPGEAKARFAAAWSESERAFALARAQREGRDMLSAQDAQQFAARWVRAEQERLVRTHAFTDYLVEAGESGWQLGNVEAVHTVYQTVRQSIEVGDEFDWGSVVRTFMERVLRENLVPVPPRGTAAEENAMLAFREHLEVLSDWAMDRHDGHKVLPGVGVLAVAPIRSESPPAVDRGNGRRLTVLFESYAKEKVLNDGDTRGTRRTVNAYRAIVNDFAELHGDLPVSAITRELVASHRALLAKLPASGEGVRKLTAPMLIEKAEAEGLPRITEPTIRNRLRALSAVLSHGVRLGWLSENPVIASGIGRAAAKAAAKHRAAGARRKHYTSDELRMIFGSPVFSRAGWTPPKAQFGKAWFWLPLLLYYTGARREELAQLKPSEVQQIDGCWCLSILATGEDDGRGVKTVGSRRLVPLHPDLLLRGFVDYVASVPADGQLFPSLAPNPAGYFGANFGKRWADYLRTVVKLDSPASPVHGFRHTFKTLCREVGIPEDVHDAITGHAGEGGVARGYGAMPLSRMAEEIRRLPAAPLARAVTAGVPGG